MKTNALFLSSPFRPLSASEAMSNVSRIYPLSPIKEEDQPSNHNEPRNDGNYDPQGHSTWINVELCTPAGPLGHFPPTQNEKRRRRKWRRKRVLRRIILRERNANHLGIWDQSSPRVEVPLALSVRKWRIKYSGRDRRLRWLSSVRDTEVKVVDIRRSTA